MGDMGMACHSRRHLFVLPKGDEEMQRSMSLTMCAAYGDDGIPCPVSFDCVCYPRVMMACDALLYSTIWVSQGPCVNSTPDIIRPCVLPKGDDGMSRMTLSNRVCSLKGDDGIQRTTSPDRVCCSKAMIACHTRCIPIMCGFQGR